MCKACGNCQISGLCLAMQDSSKNQQMEFIISHRNFNIP